MQMTKSAESRIDVRDVLFGVVCTPEYSMEFHGIGRVIEGEVIDVSPQYEPSTPQIELLV